MDSCLGSQLFRGSRNTAALNLKKQQQVPVLVDSDNDGIWSSGCAGYGKRAPDEAARPTTMLVSNGAKEARRPFDACEILDQHGKDLPRARDQVQGNPEQRKRISKPAGQGNAHLLEHKGRKRGCDKRACGAQSELLSGQVSHKGEPGYIRKQHRNSKPSRRLAVKHTVLRFAAMRVLRELALAMVNQFWIVGCGANNRGGPTLCAQLRLVGMDKERLLQECF